MVRRPHEGNQELYEAMSPFHRIREDVPPFLVVQGGNDTLVDVNVARHFVDEVAEHGARGRPAAGPAPVEHELAGRLPLNEDGVEGPANIRFMSRRR